MIDGWSHIWNKRISETMKLGELFKKVQESRWKWYGPLVKKNLLERDYDSN